MSKSPPKPKKPNRRTVFINESVRPATKDLIARLTAKLNEDPGAIHVGRVEPLNRYEVVHHALLMLAEEHGVEPEK